MRDVFVKRLDELVARYDNLVLITGDLGFGVLDGFAEKHPKHFLNAGVAEQNMTAVAVGMALEGKVVFTYSIANFCTLRCLEQIRNDAAYHDANVKVVSIGGGFSYGALGFSHHATEDLAILRAVPGVCVVSPGDDWETYEATEALVKYPGTCYLRLDKSTAGNTQQPGEVFQLGKGRILREGRHLSLIATGGILEEALKAADILRPQGVECRVVSMHTLRPLDGELLIDCARNSGGILTLEEHLVDGGLGGATAEFLMEQGTIPKKFRRMGIRDEFVSTVGSQAFLRKKCGIDAEGIVRTALELAG